METIETHVGFNGDVVEVTYIVPDGLLWNKGGYLEDGSYDCPEDSVAARLLQSLSERSDLYAAELSPAHIAEGNRAACTMKLVPATSADTDTVQRKVRIFTLLLLLRVDTIDELENYQFKTTVVGKKYHRQADIPAALAVNSIDQPKSISGLWAGS